MKRILLPLSICLLAAPALAENKAGQIVINPAIGYLYFDSERNLDEAVMGIIGLEYRFGPNWAAEGVYAMAKSEADGSGVDVDQTQMRIDGLYYFNAAGNFQPYLAGGVGNADFDVDGTSGDDETELNFGGGVRYLFNEALSLRADVRALHSLDDDMDDALVSLGISYAFGGSETKKSEPAPAPVVAVAPMDSDADGVMDADDKCPGTAVGTAVDATGCELDSDADGVMDSMDECAATPAGTKVDARGCVPQKTTVESITVNIAFPSNSDSIPDAYQSEIKKVADFMNKHWDLVVDIEGYTDSQGAEKYNQILSQRRADAVKKQLITRYNIAAERVNATGHGEANPIASNDTAEGRSKNRRVVAVMQKEIME